MQRYKQRTAATGRVQPIVPSNWLGDEVRRWGGYSVEPAVIANSVPSNIFRPMDKSALSEELLGERTDRFRILVSSYTLNEERKGVVSRWKPSGG